MRVFHASFFFFNGWFFTKINVTAILQVMIADFNSAVIWMVRMISCFPPDLNSSCLLSKPWRTVPSAQIFN